MANRFQMNQEEARELLQHGATEEVSFVCDVDDRDHLHVGWAGETGSGLSARGLLSIHEGGSESRVFMAAPRLRALASALLNVADRIDGETPLAFFPPGSPDGVEPDLPTKENE